jgi:hypothetical protein
VDLVKLQGRQLKSGWEKEKKGLNMGKKYLFLSPTFLLSLTGPDVQDYLRVFLFPLYEEE